MATISNGTKTITPDLILGYETAQESRNIIHKIIGRPDPDVTLQPAALRNGQLSMFFLTGAAAVACQALHAGAAVFTLTAPELPSIAMRYVVDGTISPALVEPTTGRWTVSVDYQEVY